MSTDPPPEKSATGGPTFIDKRDVSTDPAAVEASVLEMINEDDPILLVIDGDPPTVWMIVNGKYAGPVQSAVICDKHVWFWVKVGTHLIRTVDTVMHCNVKINRMIVFVQIRVMHCSVKINRMICVCAD